MGTCSPSWGVRLRSLHTSEKHHGLETTPWGGDPRGDLALRPPAARKRRSQSRLAGVPRSGPDEHLRERAPEEMAEGRAATGLEVFPVRRRVFGRVDRRRDDLHGRRLRRRGNGPHAGHGRQAAVEIAQRRRVAGGQPRLAHHAHLQRRRLVSHEPHRPPGGLRRPVGQGDLGRGSQGAVRRPVRRLGAGRKRDRRRRQRPLHARRTQRPRRGPRQTHRQDRLGQYRNRAYGRVLLAHVVVTRRACGS